MSGVLQCWLDLDLDRAHRLVSDPSNPCYVPEIRDRKAEAMRLFHPGDCLKGSWMLHFNHLRPKALRAHRSIAINCSR